MTHYIIQSSVLLRIFLSESYQTTVKLDNADTVKSYLDLDNMIAI